MKVSVAVVVATAVAVGVVGPCIAYDPPPPEAYIRALAPGTNAVVKQGGSEIPASCLQSLFAGDHIWVKTGSVEIVNLRTGRRREVEVGDPYVIVAESAGFQLSATLMRLLNAAQRQIFPAAARDGSNSPERPAPDGLRFGPTAAIAFTWTDSASAPRAKTLKIRRTDGTGTRIVVDMPRPPQIWPVEHPVVPGVWEWSVLDAKDTAFAGGKFGILSQAEAETARDKYRPQAARDYPDEVRDAAVELMAAKDGILLR